MKNFGHPIHYDDFWQLCDPNVDSCFHKPFDIGVGETCLSNGKMVLRTLQTVLDDDKVSYEESAEARRRIAALNWKFFENHQEEKNEQRPGWKSDWKALWDIGGKLARPTVDVWKERVKEEKLDGYDFVDIPRINVGKSRVCVPLSILQLMRRLPNCEIYTGSDGNHSVTGERQWLYFKFTGGRGMAPSVKMKHLGPADGVPALYGICKPKHDAGLAALDQAF